MASHDPAAAWVHLRRPTKLEATALIVFSPLAVLIVLMHAVVRLFMALATFFEDVLR